MNTQLFLESEELDVSSEISSLINFELDNIREFAKRSTTWSKTIVLPGTLRNNRMFGFIFNIGHASDYNELLPNSGYNFNASKSARCILFQNQIQTFKGVMRLLQINIDKNSIEYEVAVFGELTSLNVSLISKKLEDLDFSAYNHSFDETNIINSWSASPGSGYYYPLIDYGTYSTGKHDWDIKTFRPAFFVKEYIDKMFDDCGFRYESDLFETNRFKRLIVPHNQKTLTSQNTELVEVTISSTKIDPFLFAWDLITPGNFSLQNSNRNIRYDGAATVNGKVKVTVSGEYKNQDVTINFYKNNTGSPIISRTLVYTGSGTIQQFFSFTEEVVTSLNTNDFINCNISFANNVGTNYHNITLNTVNYISDVAQDVEINYLDGIIANDLIPKNIRQIDFLVSIVNLFNLYVYEDRFDERLIYIKPYVDFYSVYPTDAVDWSAKLNRDKVVKIKPMSEINAKKYEFKFKQDSDYYNELYRNRYAEGYGNYVFDSQFEFAENSKSFELIFSATPLVGYSGEEKVYPTIFKQSSGNEERVSSNIRIMQTKLVTGVTSWNIKNGVTVLTSRTDYGYAGHFDDPDAPTNDLNFGATRELFFTLLSGDTSANQFNVYWSSYMAEITDKDSKLVSAYFYLTPKDIADLDFSKKVNVDGILFRLNSIKDYNASNFTDCEVELLKVNYLLY